MTADDLSPILAHYRTGIEASRLERGSGRLERARTREILTRYLPAPPARIVDVGGGPGSYAAWLASQGYTVQLLDLVPLHVDQARRRFDAEGLSSAHAEIGDARQLPFASDSQDAALLLGPLYHLPAHEERLTALSEARRVLEPGGVVVAAAISRYASLLDGFFRGFISDPVFRDIVDKDIETGTHENPSGNPSYFTTAYFHHPDELASELEQAGFTAVDVLPVEGPFWCLPQLEATWSDVELRTSLLHFLKKTEGDRSLLGVSAHLLGVGRRPG